MGVEVFPRLLYSFLRGVSKVFLKAFPEPKQGLSRGQLSYLFPSREKIETKKTYSTASKRKKKTKNPVKTFLPLTPP